MASSYVPAAETALPEYQNTGVPCERPCYSEGSSRVKCATGFCGSSGACCRLGTKEGNVCDGSHGCDRTHCCTGPGPPAPPPPDREWGHIQNEGKPCYHHCCLSRGAVADPFSTGPGTSGQGSEHMLASKECDGAETEWCWSGFCGGGLCCSRGASAKGGPCGGDRGCDGHKCCTSVDTPPPPPAQAVPPAAEAVQTAGTGVPAVAERAEAGRGGETAPPQPAGGSEAAAVNAASDALAAEDAAASAEARPAQGEAQGALQGAAQTHGLAQGAALGAAPDRYGSPSLLTRLPAVFEPSAFRPFDLLPPSASRNALGPAASVPRPQPQPAATTASYPARPQHHPHPTQHATPTNVLTSPERTHHDAPPTPNSGPQGSLDFAAVGLGAAAAVAAVLCPLLLLLCARRWRRRQAQPTSDALGRGGLRGGPAFGVVPCDPAEADHPTADATADAPPSAACLRWLLTVTGYARVPTPIMRLEHAFEDESIVSGADGYDPDGRRGEELEAFEKHPNAFGALRPARGLGGRVGSIGGGAPREPGAVAEGLSRHRREHGAVAAERGQLRDSSLGRCSPRGLGRGGAEALGAHCGGRGHSRPSGDGVELGRSGRHGGRHGERHGYECRSVHLDEGRGGGGWERGSGGRDEGYGAECGARLARMYANVVSPQGQPAMQRAAPQRAVPASGRAGSPGPAGAHRGVHGGGVGAWTRQLPPPAPCGQGRAAGAALRREAGWAAEEAAAAQSPFVRPEEELVGTTAIGRGRVAELHARIEGMHARGRGRGPSGMPMRGSR